MKTSQLIDGLAADVSASHSSRRSRMIVLAAWAAGVAACGLAFWIVLGPREDMAAITKTWRFDFKVLWTIVLVTTSLRAAIQLLSPAVGPGALRNALLLPAAVLLLGVGVEFALTAPSAWLAKAVGSNSRICLTAIPSLSILPLAAILPALRLGAPSSPVAAGAAAGLLSAAIAASFYALQCTDDSPLFLAMWYLPAMAISTGLGALLGRCLLHW